MGNDELYDKSGAYHPEWDEFADVESDDQEDQEDQEHQDQEEQEYAENYPVVTVDGDDVYKGIVHYGAIEPQPLDPSETDRIAVSFPDSENGYQTDAQRAAPLGWANSAAITLDRKDDAITLSVSVGDPRGAFTLTVRRLSDGTLVMHVPYVNESFQHMPLTLLHEGTYKIGN